MHIQYNLKNTTFTPPDQITSNIQTQYKQTYEKIEKINDIFKILGKIKEGQKFSLNKTVEKISDSDLIKNSYLDTISTVSTVSNVNCPINFLFDEEINHSSELIDHSNSNEEIKETIENLKNVDLKLNEIMQDVKKYLSYSLEFTVNSSEEEFRLWNINANKLIKKIKETQDRSTGSRDEKSRSGN